MLLFLLVTCVIQATAAVLVVEARKNGELPDRHLVWELFHCLKARGLRRVVVAVNKMDAVAYNKVRAA